MNLFQMHFILITLSYWLLSFFLSLMDYWYMYFPFFKLSSLQFVLIAETVVSSKDYVHIKMVYIKSKNVSETFYFFRKQRIFQTFAALIILLYFKI